MYKMINITCNILANYNTFDALDFEGETDIWNQEHNISVNIASDSLATPRAEQLTVLQPASIAVVHVRNDSISKAQNKCRMKS